MWRNFLLNESLVLRVFLVFTLTSSSLASPVYTNDQDSCPPVPLHPALLCQVIWQDVVEVSPPSCDSLLSATPLPPCHLCHNLCLLCRMLLNIFLHVLSPLLHLPLCLVLSPLPLVSLSGQLTGSCRAFPATRAAGKRPSAALFDVPSPLILFTWTALCAHFLLNRSSTHSLVLSLLCNHSSSNVSISPQHRPGQSQIRARLRWF